MSTGIPVVPSVSLPRSNLTAVVLPPVPSDVALPPVVLVPAELVGSVDPLLVDVGGAPVVPVAVIVADSPAGRPSSPHPHVPTTIKTPQPTRHDRRTLFTRHLRGAGFHAAHALTSAPAGAHPRL
jgi:hypothetical protein